MGNTLASQLSDPRFNSQQTVNMLRNFVTCLPGTKGNQLIICTVFSSIPTTGCHDF